MLSQTIRFLLIMSVSVVVLGILTACAATPPLMPTPTAIPATATITTATHPPASARATADARYPDERDLMVATCSRCHSVDVIAGAHKTRAEWNETIDQMVTV